MNYLKLILSILVINISILSAAEFTVCTYNCGGLSEHYDYLRAATMQKLMQERYNAEPENMALNEKIQKLALKILFSTNEYEKEAAQREWDQNDYQHVFEKLTAAPISPNSINTVWNKKAEEMITDYKTRPVVIHDKEVNKTLNAHLKDLTRNKNANKFQLLDDVYTTMAKRTFAHQLKYDIICLQEADFLDAALFPKHYEVVLSDSAHSVNGVAFNKNRFLLVETIGSILGRGFAVQLEDKETGKMVLIASGHITGCNPFYVENGDSAKGDGELQTIVNLFDDHGSDLMIIGIDSNVTSLHPRLNILKNANYKLDYENFIDPTCTNPYQILNTRIDWIALKANAEASVTNIPILNVGLNSIQTNMSDHKPVAARIKY